VHRPGKRLLTDLLFRFHFNLLDILAWKVWDLGVVYFATRTATPETFIKFERSWLLEERGFECRLPQATHWRAA